MGEEPRLEASGRGGAPALGTWLAANRPVVFFVAGFGLWIGLFSLLFQSSQVEEHLIVPMTEGIARLSNIFIRLLGFDTQVAGTLITGADGFSVNILKGCNGAYVLAIYLSAVLAYPSSLKEKALGALLGVPAVQGINLIRIVSLYYIGARHPSLFERFHYHVWQSAVIVLSMAVWIVWAELLVAARRR